MDAKQRDLPFREIHRKMIRILRNFIERELTNNVCFGAITDDSVGLQLHWSIIEEFGTAGQDLTDESNAIVGFHGFDFDIDIDFAGSEQQLAWRSSHATDPGKHRLFESVKNQ